RCMHEFVASAEQLKQSTGLKQPAMDVGKRLLDFGFHAPTVYFPLTVHDAMMIEPTETESMETLNAFAEALFHISGESAEMLQDAPHTTVISRPDEVAAARNPTLKWTPPD
ncbi:MAG: aminomethyl-transferring glycine dehydrogenase subunit GcvPB, partial [Planctomycetota bacterium]